MNSWWRGIKIGLVIIGTTIGAGFATGREIWEFFGSYGEGSQYGILLFAVLFGISSYIILSICFAQKTENYYALLQQLMGERAARIFDYIMIIYLLLLTVVMFAGSGAAAGDQGMPEMYGILLCAILVFFVVAGNINGIIQFNAWMIPILIGVLLFLALSHLIQGAQEMKITNFSLHIVPSAIIYTSLNVVPLISVLSTFGTEIKNKKEIRIAVFTTMIGIGSLAYLLNSAILKISGSFEDLQIPLFSLIRIWPEWVTLWMTILLLIAIISTAISGVYGAARRVSMKYQYPLWKTSLVITMLAIPLSAYGFENLIKNFYPIFGLVNLFLLGLILIYPLKNAQ